jgi:two-component system sensor histidine kinase KdpD
MTDPRRPDPDQLLADIRQEEERQRRGKLKIFFGANAGVGKTYAMLSAARQSAEQGVDVVVGVAETHGRAETAALLEGLEVLPLKTIEYRGRTLREFDLDGALARRPALILVDELAHSNVPGSRHPKRWQDVEELLAAGIDVYTTVNVQHLETLNDVVGQITGIKVWETVPDGVFDRADQVVLVDLTPDELLQRLQEGKVYIPAQAERAVQNFFRKGNLIALRELALRRTADRVDDEMLAYRRQKSVESVWQTRDALLVAVGPYPGDEKLIRSAGRLAAQLGAPWHAVYVETPDLQRIGEARRLRIVRMLQLAESLGAETETLPGQGAVAALVDYARDHNLSKIVVGHGHAPLGWLRRSFAEKLARYASDLDIIRIAHEEGNGTGNAARPAPAATAHKRPIPWAAYGLAAGLCAGLAGLALPLRDYLDPVNIVMLFLLAVVVVAVRYGRGPAIFAAVLGVGLFDFFFVPPQLSFAVGDVQYLLTFGVMLAVALIIGHLAAGLRYQVRVALHREERSRALYGMARDLSGALLPEQVVDICDRYIEHSFRAKAAILLPDEEGRLQETETGPRRLSGVDTAVAQWAFDHAEPAGLGTDTIPASSILYLPLKAPARTRGVLAVRPERPRLLLVPEQRRLLETFATLIAIALERVHYADTAQNALIKIESERLRGSLLSALSHDIRTPLTALVGLAESLQLTQPGLSPEQADIARTIAEQAERVNTLMSNLLDMARLEGGAVRLNREWQPLEEVVDSAIKDRAHLLRAHELKISVPRDLPLVEFDAVLVERVLVNLLENAGKYTPPGTRIFIEAKVIGFEVYVSVSDNGPGLPKGSEESVFEKFVRGRPETSPGGMGLGLAICRAIVEAHGGRIWAENRLAGGVRFTFTLPLGEPPPLEETAPPVEVQMAP